MSSRERHNYEYTVNLDEDTAATKVVRMVGAGKRVLEIGPGPGSTTRVLQQNKCRITAIEIDESAIAKLSEFCEKVHVCDLNARDWNAELAEEGCFDVVVAADVFEHLYWPQHCLADIKPLIAQDGYMVVSLPHAGNNAIVASILCGDFEYRDSGLLDRTHIRFFCLKNMQDLFESSGFKIVAAEFFIKRPRKTEFKSAWKKLPWYVRQSLRFNKFGDIYQVVIKAVPTEAAGEPINLVEIPVHS
jgi:2-polyprenyl-3-methyl-5-hydroxy-6-metoxy-1,4-benzoquinol methylase